MSGEDTRDDRFRAGESVSWRGMAANLALVAFKLVDVVLGLRVPEEEEREGLDITSHGESAYHH